MILRQFFAFLLQFFFFFFCLLPIQLFFSLRCLIRLRSCYQTTAAISPEIALLHLNKPNISPTCCHRPQIGKQLRGPAGRVDLSELLVSPLRGCAGFSPRCGFTHIVSPQCHSSSTVLVFPPFLLLWSLVLVALLFCIIAVGTKKKKPKPQC